jgi:SEC-C motif
MDAIANLGLEDMTEQVRALFETAQIPPDYCDFGHFLEDLRATLDAGGGAAGRHFQKFLITDTIAELSKWHCYTEAFFAEQKRRKVSNAFRVAPWTDPFVHRAPKIGRNEPCPCGSGRKYKKCCLH